MILVCVLLFGIFVLQGFHFHFWNGYFCITLTYPFTVEVLSLSVSVTYSVH